MLAETFLTPIVNQFRQRLTFIMTIHDNALEMPSTSTTYTEISVVNKFLEIDDSNIKVALPGALPPSLPASLPVSVAPSRSPSPQPQEHIEAVAPPPPTVEQKTKSILDILEGYRMNTAKGASKKWVGRPKVGVQVQEHLNNNTIIRMILPAFPFKSPNKGGKVLGTLPDTAEEVALRHLHGMCVRIEEIHPAGAQIHIVSDGLMYNDLLGVSDLEVWRYGQMLRKMAKELGCYSVKFVRLANLLGRDDIDKLDEERYLREAPGFRSELHDKNLPEGFDATSFIANEPDATLTYRGYIKFLEKDLEQSSASKPPAQRKKFHEETAKAMMGRGKVMTRTQMLRPKLIMTGLRSSNCQTVPRLHSAVHPCIGIRGYQAVGVSHSSTWSLFNDAMALDLGSSCGRVHHHVACPSRASFDPRSHL